MGFRGEVRLEVLGIALRLRNSLQSILKRNSYLKIEKGYKGKLLG